MTSRLAHIGVPEMAVYGASKGALRALTHGAAVELAPLGIRVNAVAPGMTETPLFSEWIAERPDPEAARAEVEGRIPLGRLASPEDVAERDRLPGRRLRRAHHRRHPAGRRRLHRCLTPEHRSDN